MNINNPEELKKYFEEFKELVKNEEADKAMHMLEELLKSIEEQVKVRRAGSIDARGNISISEPQDNCEHIYMSLNHVMEYYVYACYFEPETDVLCTELPVGEYYRTFGSLCLKLSKFRRAEDAFKKAICWNPVDLDSYLGLAECYKNLNMLSRYLDVTKQAYRFCCSRATMARYYRNMGFYYVARYNTEAARVCYTYSNIYYKTDNADNELKYLEQALNDKTPEYSVKQMQEILDKNEVEPGPDSKTIGIIYRVGELMMNDKDYSLARDCFSIVYDITQETQLKTLLDELDKDLEDNNA